MNEIKSLLDSYQLDFENEDKRTLFLNLLSERIAYMISHDFQGLMQALYRIDLNEEKLKMRISNSTPDQVPLVIAEMIIERQEQKLFFRKKYKQGRG